MTVVLDGESLTIGDVIRVARAGDRVEVSADAMEMMRRAREVVERVLARGDRVYGLSTGVGLRRKFGVPLNEQDVFNRKIIANHRIGQGPEVSEEIVRAAMLGLANGFARGTAGVRAELTERIVEALNSGTSPPIPLYGSIGLTDTGPSAELAYRLLADFPLAAKEGVALMNTNVFSTGWAALAVGDTFRLADALDVAGALDLEAFAGNLNILHPIVGMTRPYPGLQRSLDHLRAVLDGSSLWEDGAARNLQDPLTFRCLPQIHGALRDALDFAARQLELELNASQENPLLIVEEERLVSVGNFEVLPLAAALDFLRIALAPALTSACERTEKILQAPLSGLTEGLAVRMGLAEDSLLELAVTSQALAAEARLLAQPVSFELVTTTHAEGIEDRMTMAPLAARRLAEMVSLGERVVAIELVVACQAVDLRGSVALGAGTHRVYELIRKHIPFMGEDDPHPQNLEPIVELVKSGSLTTSA